MMPNFNHFNSLLSIFSYFRTNKTCTNFLEKQRWADGVVCPYCGKKHAVKRGDGRYICLSCNKSFSVLVGTIFENTKLPLNKWFAAMYMEASNSNGASSVQIARDLQITQKTAWYMLQKIRTLYKQSDDMQMSGIIECDEKYLGGRETNKHKRHRISGTQGRSTKTKTPIFGMLEYKRVVTPAGRKEVNTFVRAMKVSDAKSETLIPIIRRFAKENSVIITDELSSYIKIEECNAYTHKVVKHKDAEYGKGELSTNRIEGFWACFSRMIFATYHYVSREYLQRYIDEACFRYNTRRMKVGERFKIMLLNSIGKCDYSQVRQVA